MPESWRVANELRQRTGHRFNVIIKNLPEDSESAITFVELLKRVEADGYLGGGAELTENLDALAKRKEIAVKTDSGDTKRYYATRRGKLEYRKRIALIKLHTRELSEKEIATLEKMTEKPR